MQKSLGIIDSGIGGLSILKELISKISSYQIYYISDEDNVPYGNKSQNFMFDRTVAMVNQLKQVHVTKIILACNTLTAKTIDRLREKFDEIEFFGIEPYINYLNKDLSAHGKNTGLILTQATFDSLRFKNLQQRVDPENLIKVYPLKHLAMIIESLKTKNFEFVLPEINLELAPLKSKKLDILILGCTHYPIISSHIAKQLKVQCVNSHGRFVEHIVNKLNAFCDKHGPYSFFYDSNLSGNWLKVDIKDFQFLFLDT